MIDLLSTSADDRRALPARIHDHAIRQPGKLAITDGNACLTYADLDGMMDRVAASLQRDGAVRGNVIACVANSSIAQALVFLGALRAGAVPALIQPSGSSDQISVMIADSNAAIAFLDATTAASLGEDGKATATVLIEDLEGWLRSPAARPEPVEVGLEDPFNIIYSSGTTGVPKGIVISHGMRVDQFASYAPFGYDTAVTMVSTPLYSSTTLVAFLPTLAYGGTVVLMGKFDARQYLELAERHRATHTMLVPVQYQRIMDLSDFEVFDLSAFRLKFCTSAPFKVALKADIVRRWPGALIEFYGMTEGGGSTVLYATEWPDKLHTVGQPAPGHELRLIDEDGIEVAHGEAGEVVGRSGAMMSGYHGREQATADATWTSPESKRFMRHGDVGRFDKDGFLILVDRKKDMIISGGFNIYPSDIEAVLGQHPAVAECSVVGTPSDLWGETPVGFYVAAEKTRVALEDILAEVNQRLGRTQRLSALHRVEELPRSPIGKVLKRELRDRLGGGELG